LAIFLFKYFFPTRPAHLLLVLVPSLVGAHLRLALQQRLHQALLAAEREDFEDQFHNLEHGDQREADPQADVAAQIGEQVDQLRSK
jgi:hypothetical protein